MTTDQAPQAGVTDRQADSRRASGGLSGLPGAIKVMLGGTVVNMLGNGLVLPFTGVYLHEAQGLTLSQTGVVLGVLGGAAIVAAPFLGTLVDRLGAKRVLVTLMLLAAAGYTSFLWVHSFPAALGAAALAGASNASFAAQGALINSLGSREQQTAAFAGVRWAMNLGVGIGGVTGGFLAVNGRPDTYRRLFVLDVVTFLVFALVVSLVRNPHGAPTSGSAEQRHSTASMRGGYAAIFRLPWLRSFLLLDLATAATFAACFDLLPPYAVDSLALRNRTIGLLFLVNTFTVVLLQLPVLRWVSGRSRMGLYALMHVGWLVGLLLVLSTEALPRDALVAVLLLAMVVLGLSECLLGPLRGPIAIELVPPELVGRTIAIGGAIFQLGMAAGRAGGGYVLDRAPALLWIAAATIASAGALVSMRLGRTIPATSAVVPAGR